MPLVSCAILCTFGEGIGTTFATEQNRRGCPCVRESVIGELLRFEHWGPDTMELIKTGWSQSTEWVRGLFLCSRCHPVAGEGSFGGTVGTISFLLAWEAFSYLRSQLEKRSNGFRSDNRVNQEFSQPDRTGPNNVSGVSFFVHYLLIKRGELSHEESTCT